MPSPPFLATVLVPSPCRTLRSSWWWAARCPTLATKAFSSEAVISPFRKGSVEGGVVDFSLAFVVLGHGQTLPLHTGVEHPQDEVEEAMIAEFTLRSALRHGEMR